MSGGKHSSAQEGTAGGLPTQLLAPRAASAPPQALGSTAPIGLQVEAACGDRSGRRGVAVAFPGSPPTPELLLLGDRGA